MREIFARYSVRYFQNKPVEPEKIERLIEAGFRAPSAHNQQAWEVLVLRKREQLLALAPASKYYSPLERCPLALVVLADRQKFKAAPFWQQDLAALTQNILLAAVSLDLGGVWLGLAPNRAHMNDIAKELKLPEHIWPFSIIALGYPEATEQPRIESRAGKVYYDEYPQLG